MADENIQFVQELYIVLTQSDKHLKTKVYAELYHGLKF